MAVNRLLCYIDARSFGECKRTATGDPVSSEIKMTLFDNVSIITGQLIHKVVIQDIHAGLLVPRDPC
jgi:hypothetical protein